MRGRLVVLGTTAIVLQIARIGPAWAPSQAAAVVVLVACGAS